MQPNHDVTIVHRLHRLFSLKDDILYEKKKQKIHKKYVGIMQFNWNLGIDSNSGNSWDKNKYFLKKKTGMVKKKIFT